MSKSRPGPDRYALVGHPVAHSRSPLIHELFARQTGQNLTYELIDAEAADFSRAVRDFVEAGGKGMNVTVPHKEAAYRLATSLGPEAKAAGAVNTLTFDLEGVRGDNTDGIGFMRDVTENLAEPIANRRVLVLGAGGAVRGILPPVIKAHPAEVVVANRTLARAEALQKSLAAGERFSVCRFEDLDDAEPFDIVVNATSAGVKGEDPPFPPSVIGGATFCYDLAYSSKTTPFVAWAEQHGADRAVQGWGMLIEQAAESFRIWRGIRPDTEPLIRQFARRR